MKSPGAARAAAQQRLALFDLDGTLLEGDTDQLWCAFLIDEGVLERAAFEAANADVSARYAAGKIEPAEFCGFYAATLAGRAAEQWAPLRERFVAASVAPRIGAAARALVKRCHSAGDELVLTTATSRFLAEPIAALLGIGHVVASELEVDAAGAFTGRNQGVLNMRAGKVERIGAWLATRGESIGRLDEAVFYSDSINDLPLLAAVGRAIVVDPDERLADAAAVRGWPTLRLAGRTLPDES